MPFKDIKNILFDTSFLLKDSKDIDDIIKILQRDHILCFISNTVQTELDNLFYVDRLSKAQYNVAMLRIKKAKAVNIEKNRNYLKDTITKECTTSMNSEHGVESNDIRNDCSILTVALYNNIDLILSEDFHFTSRYTENVVDTISANTCNRFHKLCESDILLLDKDSFLAAYQGKKVDLKIVESMKQDIKKDSKLLKKE